ncbi:MAG: hypothetical protein Q9222_003419 [Ikaeria aurantiellina]
MINNLPVEIALLILSYLFKADIKQLRLVCKDYATLGGQVLVENLYISPRERDMEAFDGITQHADLRQGVKRLIYDLLHFEAYDILSYIEHLDNQFKDPDASGQLDPDGYLIRDLLKPEYARTMRSDHPKAEVKSRRRLSRHPVIINSFERYLAYQSEQRNVLSTGWFNRVRRGLDQVGNLQFVSIENTMLWRLEADAEYARRRGFRVEDVSLWHHQNFEDPEVQENLWVLNHGSTAQYIDRAYMPRRSFYLPWNRWVGSPVARSYPPSMLNPTTPQSDPNAVRYIKPIEWARFEKVIQLLRVTGKTPQQLVAGDEGNDFCSLYRGTYPCSFAPKRWSWISEAMVHLAQGLRVLCLRIPECHGWDIGPQFDTCHRYPTLSGLQELFRNTPCLEELELHLPATVLRFLHHTPASRYRFDQIFPAMSELTLHNLRHLALSGLSMRYKDIAELFFIHMQSLTYVYVSHIDIPDGKWADIIEGFRHIKPTLSGKFGPDLQLPEADNMMGYDTDWEPMKSAFGEKLRRYLEDGVRNPYLPYDCPAYHCEKYFSRLQATLDILRADHAENARSANDSGENRSEGGFSDSDGAAVDGEFFEAGLFG